MQRTSQVEVYYCYWSPLNCFLHFLQHFDYHRQVWLNYHGFFQILSILVAFPILKSKLWWLISYIIRYSPFCHKFSNNVNLIIDTTYVILRKHSCNNISFSMSSYALTSRQHFLLWSLVELRHWTMWKRMNLYLQRIQLILKNLIQTYLQFYLRPNFLSFWRYRSIHFSYYFV